LKRIFFAHIALFIVNLIYALNYTIAKDVMPGYIEPSGFILLRVLCGVFLFSFFYFLFIKESVGKKDFFRLALCGLFGVAINQLFFFEGLNLTTPINAAIIMTVNPVLVIIISALLIGEKITVKKIIGIVLGIIGAGALILNSGSVSFDNDFFIGNLLVLINATSYAIYLVLVKGLMKKYNPLTVMFFVFLFGLFFVLPFGYQDLNSVNIDSFTNDIYLKILFVVVCTTFIAYLLNAFALKSLNPSIVSIYIYLQPVLASVIAILYNSDTIDYIKIVSSIFIFIAVFLVSIPTKKVITN
jgi:drug/metabolite transporter (DMT)-like permease|tara:strand:- start:2190 stop:3086 length:897 start_codon:yes stop_codon:yes gene_type:complete